MMMVGVNAFSLSFRLFLLFGRGRNYFVRNGTGCPHVDVTNYRIICKRNESVILLPFPGYLVLRGTGIVEVHKTMICGDTLTSTTLPST